MIDAGEFLEWADVFGNFYGTCGPETERLLSAGRDVVLVIDVQGAQQVRECGLAFVSIFVLPPSFTELEQRLRGRSKDSDAAIRRRLEVASSEVSGYHDYDYVIVNDELDIGRRRPAIDRHGRAGAGEPDAAGRRRDHQHVPQAGPGLTGHGADRGRSERGRRRLQGRRGRARAAEARPRRGRDPDARGAAVRDAADVRGADPPGGDHRSVGARHQHRRRPHLADDRGGGAGRGAGHRQPDRQARARARRRLPDHVRAGDAVPDPAGAGDEHADAGAPGRRGQPGDAARDAASA